jgi:hypothetical protein
VQRRPPVPSLADFVDAARHAKKADRRAIALGLQRVRLAANEGAFAPARDAHRLAHTILAGPEFAHPHPKPEKKEESLVDRFFNWLGSILERLFKGLRRATNLNSQQNETLVLLLAALASLGALALLVTVIRRRVERRVGVSFGAAAVAQDAGSAELLAAARARADRGEFAQAIGLTFGAALRSLDERGIVGYDAARTPGEYRRAVRRAQAPLAEPFDTLARGYVVAVYGDREPDELAWASTRAAYERVFA